MSRQLGRGYPKVSLRDPAAISNDLSFSRRLRVELHLAGGGGHLKYWHWQPIPVERGIGVDVEKLPTTTRPTSH